ncbi:cytochrome b [Aureimonas leprariae]|uniref:Cytochrome b n=1 Tax=Plantimonas leprariae TaxID=2615207 RepID=A0A7V7TWG1_9HYPH|nr:cytochrome b [Aureimonas leprariae]KAB0679649.1 cytochrome b [Aureimonas leprariae]
MSATAVDGRQMSDTHEGFGIVSRTFHWGMALLFVWQFTSAILHVFAEDTPVAAFFWGTHYSVGFTLFVLVLLRGLWGLANVNNRPPHAGARFERLAATAGQVVLYALMVVIPALMIYRAVASGRGFRVYGLQLVPPSETPAPGSEFAVYSNAHVLLAWTFLAFIAIHAALALYHAFGRRDATLDRMTKGYSERPLNPADAPRY